MMRLKKVIILIVVVLFSSLLFACTNEAQENTSVESEAPAVTAPAPDPAQQAHDETEQMLIDAFSEVLPGADVHAFDAKSHWQVSIKTAALSSTEAPADFDEICDRLLSVYDDLPEKEELSVSAKIESDDGTILLNTMNGNIKWNHYTDAEIGPLNPPTISLDEYDQIKNGMSYDEVQRIIGGPGQTLSSVGAEFGAEYSTQVVTWEGEGSLGANANITFQGEKVVVKAEFGLQ